MKLLVFIFMSIPHLLWADTSVDLAIEKLISFNKMREALASTLDGRQEPIVMETFKQTCAPAQLAFKEWGKSQGYDVKIVTDRYRNPAHAPNPQELKVIDLFKKDPSKVHHTFENKEQQTTQLYVRIPVTSSCLHCHGAKNNRPDFIQTQYPKDRAFDFKAGDLRGLYSVTIKKDSN